MSTDEKFYSVDNIDDLYSEDTLDNIKNYENDPLYATEPIFPYEQSLNKSVVDKERYIPSDSRMLKSTLKSKLDSFSCFVNPNVNKYG